MKAKTLRFSLLVSSVLRDLPCSNRDRSAVTGLASGRLDGLRLEGKMDLDGVVTVALLLAELLETVETANDCGAFFLDVEGFLECRRRVSLEEGIKENICLNLE